ALVRRRQRGDALGERASDDETGRRGRDHALGDQLGPRHDHAAAHDRRDPRAQQPQLRVDECEWMTQPLYVRVPAEQLHDSLDLVGCECVICVEQAEHVALRGGDRSVERTDLAALFLQNHLQPRVRLQAGEALTRIVRRAVVDDDDLVRRAGLRGEACETVVEEAAVVVIRDQYADTQAARAIPVTHSYAYEPRSPASSPCTARHGRASRIASTAPAMLSQPSCVWKRSSIDATSSGAICSYAIGPTSRVVIRWSAAKLPMLASSA